MGPGASMDRVPGAADHRPPGRRRVLRLVRAGPRSDARRQEVRRRRPRARHHLVGELRGEGLRRLHAHADRAGAAVCPDLVMIPHTSGLYGEVSRKMFDLCETLTPAVQRNSIDEGYLDLGPCRLRRWRRSRWRSGACRARICGELRISVSMGIAAQQAGCPDCLEARKPTASWWCPREGGGFPGPLPLGWLPGIGAKTEAALAGAACAWFATSSGAARPSSRRRSAAAGAEALAQARGEDEAGGDRARGRKELLEAGDLLG